MYTELALTWPVNNVYMNNKHKDRLTRKLKGEGCVRGRGRDMKHVKEKISLLN